MKQIEIKLKNKQQTQEGKWSFTFKGVQRIANNQVVRMTSESIKDVIEYIDENEIEEICMKIYPMFEFLDDKHLQSYHPNPSNFK